MRKMLKQQIFTAICLLALMLPLVLPAQAAEPDRYGYSLLTNDAQRAAYRVLAEGIGNMSENIELSNIGIRETDLDIVADILLYDYPEYFWYSGAYYLTVGEVVISFTPATKVNGSDEPVKGYGLSGIVVNKNSPELVAAQNAFQAAVNTALAQIPAGASDYKKTEILHDYLAGIVTYESNYDDQTAYGALVVGKAVCAGYTRAYQILLNRAGIPSFYVSGNACVHDDHMIPHAWNLLWLDGDCYYTDVTWDDQGERLLHEYFNLSLEEMRAEHIADDPLPASCGHTKYTYHKQNTVPGSGICNMNGGETGADIAPYFKLTSQTGSEVAYTCNIWCPGVDFNQWSNAHYLELAQALGLTGNIGFGWEMLGSEYRVTITGVISDSSNATQTPNGGGEVTPQPNTPPVSSQPSEQPVPPPTQPPQQPQQQPAEQTQQSTQETTEATIATEPSSTQPATTTEPSSTQPSDNTTSAPTSEPTLTPESSEPIAAEGENPTSPVIPIMVSVIVVAAGVVTIVLIKRKQ